jgi:hypothetical protein
MAAVKGLGLQFLRASGDAALRARVATRPMPPPPMEPPRPPINVQKLRGGR